MPAMQGNYHKAPKRQASPASICARVLEAWLHVLAHGRGTGIAATDVAAANDGYNYDLEP